MKKLVFRCLQENAPERCATYAAGQENGITILVQ
jgi:hypothetical protein